MHYLLLYVRITDSAVTFTWTASARRVLPLVKTLSDLCMLEAFNCHLWGNQLWCMKLPNLNLLSVSSFIAKSVLEKERTITNERKCEMSESFRWIVVSVRHEEKSLTTIALAWSLVAKHIVVCNKKTRLARQTSQCNRHVYRHKCIATWLVYIQEFAFKNFATNGFHRELFYGRIF